MEAARKRHIAVVAGIIAVIIAFALGTFFGLVLNVREQLFSSDGQVDITKVVNLHANTRSSEVDFNQYWEVWDYINAHHVEQPVNEVDLFYGSLRGMVEGLGDEYSVYFDPEAAQKFARDLQGEFEGIGAQIALRDERLIVVAPLPTSPAERAGIKAGDGIVAIDGEETAGMTLEEAITKIRGQEGTTVVLTIIRDGWETAEDISIVRAQINIPTVSWEMKENGLAYLRINHFNSHTWTDFDRAVYELLLKSPRGIILDLRSNPGGFLDVSIRVASEWVEEGTIVIERFKEGDKPAERQYTTEGKHRLAGIPTIVLVDEGTASGSEIVAGALQDHGLATLVGATTFGKGSVQDFQFFSDGSALKLTIAKWFTPDGTAIDETGITPDVVVDEMFVEGADPTDPAADLGLQRAIQLLRD